MFQLNLNSCIECLTLDGRTGQGRAVQGMAGQGRARQGFVNRGWNWFETFSFMRRETAVAWTWRFHFGYGRSKMPGLGVEQETVVAWNLVYASCNIFVSRIKALVSCNSSFTFNEISFLKPVSSKCKSTKTISPTDVQNFLALVSLLQFVNRLSDLCGWYTVVK